MLTCLHCNKALRNSARKYCSNQCQKNHEYAEYIEKWKQGLADGNRGVSTKNFSAHLLRYLINKNKGKCEICGWCEVNTITGKIPLEIDHIDGDHSNNVESNLRLICPNCHALTPSFRNLNRGKGRAWRRSKYHKAI